MKNLLLFLSISILTITTVSATSVNEKVIKIFKEAFPHTENIKWIEYENFYEVIFESNQIHCRMDYSLDGEIISATRYYDEKDLPPFILANVKEKYRGKKIFGITEVSDESGIVYTIILEDDKKWYYIESDNRGVTHLTDKFRKA